MTRHEWKKIKPRRFYNSRTGEPTKTERECSKCGLMKVTRHEGREHWIEFWSGEDQITGTGTPPCVAEVAEAIAKRMEASNGQ